MPPPSQPDQALAAQLRAKADQLARDHPAYIAAVAAFVARLEATRAGMGAPAPGALMPAFLLPDADGGLTGLADFAGRPLALFFMRGHWCPFCRTQAEALHAIAPLIAEMGAQAVVITPERPVFARGLTTAPAPFKLLFDLDNGYAAEVGIAAVLDDAIVAALIDFEIDLPAYQGAAGWVAPLPAMFVLDGLGRVVYRAIDPDFRRRPSLDSLLAALAQAGT